MQYKTLSDKQLAAMLWWSMDAYKDLDGVLCDGSVRSGKTMSMSVGFVLWSMSRYRNQTFAMCGKTIEALRRNVVNPLRTWLEGLFTVREHRAQNYIEIFYGDTVNRYYLFGGKDESRAYPGHHACRRDARRGRAHAALVRGAGFGALLGGGV